MENSTSNGISRRGFASMSPERRAELASRGGKAAHVKGTAHKWTSESARAAGVRGAATNRLKRIAAIAAELGDAV